MISLDEYLKQPCRSSSIPYWKTKTLSIPPDMQIVHEVEFCAQTYQAWKDCVYFRLLHSLTHFSDSSRQSIRFSTFQLDDIDFLINHINACYQDLHVTKEQFIRYTQTPVYAPQLWILASDTSTGGVLGSGIADYDPEAKEIILEWIQVLPAHRRKDVGQAIVTELLRRKSADARFATVSGKADSPTCPEALYRKCGFTGQDYWHILHK